MNLFINAATADVLFIYAATADEFVHICGHSRRICSFMRPQQMNLFIYAATADVLFTNVATKYDVLLNEARTDVLIRSWKKCCSNFIIRYVL
jgi:hypothetical protein